MTTPSALTQLARQLVADEKGLLAMDESTPTCNKRFAEAGIPQTVEYRQAYRELLVTTPGLNQSISGAILCDETIRQKTSDGATFAQTLEHAGIVPGIKVDQGTAGLARFPGEKITEGLDGLAKRLTEYRQLGARFAKWRAVITIGPGIPTNTCIAANMHLLARYAAICQETGLVPVVEPEVLMDGPHTLERCFEVTEETQRRLFHELYLQRIDLPGSILKASMVLPGKDCPAQNSVDEIAEATIRCLQRAVPAAVTGVTFLSGGQPNELATARLNAMNVKYKAIVPWALSFSFARAIQQPALHLWKGDNTHRVAAQAVLANRAWCNHLARRGEYDATKESA